MEKAIKRAIEGGYRKELTNWEFFIIDKDGSHHMEDSNICLSKEFFLLDPLFWQCLGKAEGKEKEYPGYKIDKNIFGGERIAQMIWWRVQMHRFIDHIASGKDVDSFFNSLLK